MIRLRRSPSACLRSPRRPVSVYLGRSAASAAGRAARLRRDRIFRRVRDAVDTVELRRLLTNTVSLWRQSARGRAGSKYRNDDVHAERPVQGESRMFVARSSTSRFRLAPRVIGSMQGRPTPTSIGRTGASVLVDGAR